MDEDGNTIYMPCSTHAAYVEAIGGDEEESGYGYGGRMKKPKKPKKKEDDMSYEDNVEELKSFIEVHSEIKANDTEDGTFEGYGSVFNNTDLGNDVIKTGAFTKSLAERGTRGVKLLYQHKSDMPIGVFDEISEDSHGLRVKGRLALGTTAGRDAYELLKMGALDGLSIGFRVNPKEVSYDKRKGQRIIKEVDLMEISLVTFPMNPKATVRQVKGEEISIREWENGLRDAFNLSRSEAKVAAKAVNQAFTQRDVDVDAEVVEAIKQLTLTITKL
jgi:HK97 family phage prohead protease